MAPNSQEKLNLVVTSFLEPHLIDRINAVAPDRLNVFYDPGLVQIPRYSSDHNGEDPTLTADERGKWIEWLHTADLMFDIDWMQPDRLLTNAPRLRWVQCTSAGIAEKLGRYGLADSNVTFTTCSGIHAVPLAEFVVLGLLYFRKAVPRLSRWKAEHHWEYFANEELAGDRVLLVGLGGVGGGIAQYLSGMGLHVWGGRRSDNAALPRGVERVIDMNELVTVLPEVDAVVLACPLTERTKGLIGRDELRAMKPSAVLVNVARGAVVDEQALIDTLRDGQLAGAALDVFEEEPLPPSSELWDFDNVLISPHLSATVAAENERIVEIFVGNLESFLRNEPLRNVFDAARGY